MEKLSLKPSEYFLASFHREENVDNPDHLTEIISALGSLSEEHGIETIVSTHPRTRKKMEEFKINLPKSLRFLKPFGFHDYNKLQMEARCVISDSGTISEESSMLGFPAVTIRNALERPEALDTGAIIITGLSARIISLGVQEAIRGYTDGMIADVPEDYKITNTSQRVVRLILGTAKLSNTWHGINLYD